MVHGSLFILNRLTIQNTSLAAVVLMVISVDFSDLIDLIQTNNKKHNYHCGNVPAIDRRDHVHTARYRETSALLAL